MAYEMKDFSGSLFANDKREKDTHPHARGTALIDGREYWVDAWTNTTQGGKRYQSLKFKLKERQGGSSFGEQKKSYDAPADDFEDDTEIPF